LHRRLFRHSRKVVREFDERVKNELGVTKHTAYTYRDLTTKIDFGKMKSLLRIRAIIGDVIVLLKRKKLSRALVILVQTLKALHQVHLDNGSWQTAMLMVPVVDPLYQAAFGGAEEEIEAISSYKKAHYELCRVQKAIQQPVGGKEEER
jgi:hypothetical protein